MFLSTWFVLDQPHNGRSATPCSWGRHSCKAREGCTWTHHQQNSTDASETDKVVYMLQVEDYNVCVEMCESLLCHIKTAIIHWNTIGSAAQLSNLGEIKPRKHSQHMPGLLNLVAWCAMCSTGLIGPFFFRFFHLYRGKLPGDDAGVSVSRTGSEWSCTCLPSTRRSPSLHFQVSDGIPEHQITWPMDR